VQLYINIIKLFLDRVSYEKYHSLLDYKHIKEHYLIVYRVLLLLQKVYSDSECNTIGIEELHALYLSSYPAKDLALFEAFLAELQKAEPTEPVTKYLETLVFRKETEEFALKALEVANGSVQLDRFKESLEAYKEKLNVLAESKEKTKGVDLSLKNLLAAEVGEGGLNWRLRCLQDALGPLRKGDFGFVFARPETGKTTFLASEVSHMLMDASGPVLWINNEERGTKVILRIYCAVLGTNLTNILSNQERAEHEFNQRTGGRLIFIDDASPRKSFIERLCKEHEPSLIVIDQLDKVTGFTADREDLVLSHIYVWARELAKKYGPVIGATQAGGDAEGLKWLNMAHVMGSKTGKQAEADWMLGIGIDEQGPQSVRGISICKNKLQGNINSDQINRHGKFEVIIRPEIARYQDIHQ
jgi:hypothetical protein